MTENAYLICHICVKMSKNDFYNKLKETVNSSFYSSFKKKSLVAKESYELRFRCEMITENTTTANLHGKKNLYKWICFFDEKVERLRHSEIIFSEKLTVNFLVSKVNSLEIIIPFT